MKNLLTACLLGVTTLFTGLANAQQDIYTTNNTLSKISFGFEKKVSGTFINMDGAVVCFKETFNDERGPEDANKMMNETENIGINNFGNLLSIDGRKTLSNACLISTRISRTVNDADYNLKINLTAFTDGGLKCYLRDRFTQTEVALTLAQINNYTFKTSSDTNSYFNRFTIAFSSSQSVSTLPVQFISTKVFVNQQQKHTIQWTALEKNIQLYRIEQSINGNNFTTIATEKAIGGNSYSTQQYEFNHTATVLGKVYYRISSVDANGKITTSNVFAANTDGLTQTNVMLFPTKTNNYRTTIRLNQVALDVYQVSVFTNNGKNVLNTTIQHRSQNTNYPIQLPTTLSKGMYFVKIYSQTTSVTQSLIIE